MMERIVTDVLIIGAGGAAGRAAVEAARPGITVHLVDKGIVGRSGTSTPCLLGLATTINKEDSPELFFHDWIRNGSYINDQNLVWEAVTHSLKSVESLETYGLEFLKDPDGNRSLYRGAGHTVARGVTVKSHSATGNNVTATLRAEAEKRGVHIHENIMITKLLKKDARICGAMGISPNKEIFVFNAKAVVLAAGGANRLFPNAAHEINDEKFRTMGDAFYLAFDAGVPLIDMEFAQFREGPPGGARFGGIYVNALGERFMEKYDPKALEKAPRHKVVEAVYREMKKGPVIWKVDGIRETELADMEIAKEFAGHREIELTIELQRLMGGARISENAETTIPGLFAAGESAGGVHGGGRMQGNAFLETQIFGMNAGASAASFALNNELKNSLSPEIREEESRINKFTGNIEPAVIIKAIQQTMWDDAGIVRDEKGLESACVKLEQIKSDMASRLSGQNIFSTLETKNLLLTAEMMARAALAREETRGSHIRNDFSKSDDKWLKHICITNKEGEIAISTLPVVTRPK